MSPHHRSLAAVAGRKFQRPPINTLEILDHRLQSLESLAQFIDLGGVARPRRRGLAPVGRVGSDQRSCTPHAVGEPALRPEAARATLDGTRTVLAALAEKRERLHVRAAEAEARVRDAVTDQQRVSAMFETYRVESALDDVLTGTMKQLASLMKDRGLR